MKIRTSFVGNSSTCSFVAIGFQTKKEYTSEELEELVYENDLNLYSGSEGGLPEGVEKIGREIVTIREDEDVLQTFTMKDIEKLAKELRNLFGLKYNDIEIFSGVRMC